MAVSADCCFAQSIVRLNQVGTNDWNFHNSISDEQRHIYYCTREVVNINSLNVTCMSKDLAIRWSYNYDNPGIEPISGMSYKDGKLYITTDLQSDVMILVLDKMGTVLSSKRMFSGNTTFASSVMHNNDLVIANSYNTSDASVQITRLNASFNTVFNKRIIFASGSFFPVMTN